MTPSQNALKFDAEVTHDGRVELQVPFPPGSHVTIFVIDSPDDNSADLLAASQTSLEFWNNEFDDEDWNNA